MSLCIARDILTVEGPDAAKYLQGQLSNDVAGLAVGASCWSFLLEPTGKLGFVVRVRRSGTESFVIDTDAGDAASVETRLRRFLIRTKATLTAGEMVVDLDGQGTGTELIGWWGDGTHRVTDEPVSIDAAGAAESRRIDAGWPGAAELLDGLIPGETGLVPVAASFTKGCYTGQELVARIDSRGNNVPKMLHRIVLESAAAAGDEIIVDGTAVGSLTSVSGLAALGYVRRSVTAPLDALVAGSPVRVVGLQD